MIKDVEFFKTKIGSIDGAGDAGDYLVKLAQDKSVPKPKAAAPAPVATAPEKIPEVPVTNGKESADIEADPEEKPKDATEKVKAAA